MSRSRKKVWELIVFCILLWLAGFSFLAWYQMGQGLKPNVVSLPSDWLVSQRLPDGKIVGSRQDTGNTGIFSSDGKLDLKISQFAPMDCSITPIGKQLLAISQKPDTAHSYMAMVNPDGSVEWKTLIDSYIFGSPFIVAPLVTRSGIILVAARDKVVAVSGSGDILWEKATATSLGCPLLQIGASLISADYDGEITAFDEEGNIRWVFQSGLHVFSLDAFEGGDGVYATGTDYNRIGSALLALDLQGRELWRFKPPRGIIGMSVLGDDELIYLSTGQGVPTVLSSDGQLQPVRTINTIGLGRISIDRFGNVYGLRRKSRPQNWFTLMFRVQSTRDNYWVEKYDSMDNLVGEYELGYPENYPSTFHSVTEFSVGLDNQMYTFNIE